MFKIWFERTLPAQYRVMLEEVAVSIGAGTDTPETPFAKVGEAEAMIAGSRLTYDAAVMDQAPQLRVIARTGIGVNNVDLAAATARGVAVCNAPDGPTIATAEHAVALMFALARQLKWIDKTLQTGGESDYFNRYNGLELYDACLGLVGLGRIGSHVAKIAQGIGMSIIAYDPFVKAEQAEQLGVSLSPTLEALLSQADVVSLHIPLLPETKNLINANRLAQMKPGAILINVSRGGIVDELAVRDALDKHQLSGAGLDVFDSEPPPPDHPLLGRDDVIATPHIAGATTAGKDRLWQAALSQTLQVLQGERPPHLVNSEVWRV
ncbi:MAG: hydroxyacid dehydrogenase [Anaerolineae bacterium]|nr:hydroxyacid dehydrogenase [Anaerolineae bacterium]